MKKDILVHSMAVLVGVAAGAGTAAGAVIAARGDTKGAPGITKGFARLGRLAGGSMLTGVVLAGGSAALVGLAAYEGVRQPYHRYLNNRRSLLWQR